MNNSNDLNNLAKVLAIEISKILSPRIKKVVREEIDRTVKDIIYESVVSKKRIIEEDKEGRSLNNVKEAKNILAKRSQNRKSKSIIEKMSLYDNDPTMNLIMSAEDPEDDENNKIIEQINRAGSISSSDINENNVELALDPSNINYEDRLEKLGIWT